MRFSRAPLSATTSAPNPATLLLAAALWLAAAPGCLSGSDGDPASPGGGATADAGPTSADDGNPTRVACTSSFGSLLSIAHGRLDGYLVSLVPPGHNGCNSDSDHLHLQLRVSGHVYDVAVTVASQTTTTSDVYFGQWDGPLQDDAWSEGWHPGAPLDYVQLGLHANAFTLTPKSTLVQQVTAALDGVNHISVYGTAWGPDGMHLVHRNNGSDGAVVVRPLSATPHFLVFHFTDQSF